MAARVKAFAAFWYDFIFGDDWRIAAAVIAALATTYAVSTTTVAAWWVTPAIFTVLLPYTLWRAAAVKK